MKVKLASLKANLERERKGDWISYPDWPGVSFNVSSLTQPEYETARHLLFQRLAKKYKDEPVPKDVISSELGVLYGEFILHGWKGLDVDYDPGTASETLKDPAYRSVVSAVEYCAAKIAQIEVEFTAAEEGNS